MIAASGLIKPRPRQVTAVVDATPSEERQVPRPKLDEDLVAELTNAGVRVSDQGRKSVTVNVPSRVPDTFKIQ